MFLFGIPHKIDRNCFIKYSLELTGTFQGFAPHLNRQKYRENIIQRIIANSGIDIRKQILSLN